MNGVQTRFKCKLDVKRCKRFVFPPSSLLPRSNALKTKAIRYFQTDRTLTRIVSPPLHVNLAQNVTVTGLNHNYQDAEKMIDEQGVSTLPVVIEDDVWVGANSVILPGVTLGKHCVVAAGSVVSHSVPPYSICAGCPARIIKTYDFETKEWKKVEKTPATNHK